MSEKDDLDAAIEEALKEHRAGPLGSLGDKIATPVIRGGAALVGLPGDIRDAGEAASDWIGKNLKEKSDAAFGENNVVTRGLRGFKRGFKQATGNLDLLPNSRDIQDAAFKKTGIRETDFEDKNLRKVARGAEFALGSALPGGLARNMALGAFSGLGAETGRQAFEGTDWEKTADIAGSLIAPAASLSHALIAGDGTKRLVRQATKPYDDKVLKEAQELVEAAKTRGISLTADEALQQVAGRNPELQSLRRYAEQTPEGNRILAPLATERAGQNSRAFKETEKEIFTDRPASVGVPPTRDMDLPSVGAPMSKAAEKEIKSLKADRGADVKPHYDQARREINSRKMDTRAAVHKFITGLEGEYAGRQNSFLKGHIDPLLERFRVKQAMPRGGSFTRPIDDYDTIEEARRYMRDTIAAPPAPGSAVVFDADLSRRLADHLEKLKTNLGDISDTVAGGPGTGAYNRANKMFENISETRVKPHEEGLLGAVRDTQNAHAQYSTLVPDSPGTGARPTNPTATADSVKRLAKQNPKATRDLFRSMLVGRFDEASQRFKAAGLNEQGAAAFSALVAGNKEQKATLMAALRQMPGADDAVIKGFDRLIQVFDAQQYRPPMNSATAKNQQVLRDMKGGGYANFIDNLLNVPTAPGKIRDWVDGVRMGKNAGKLAEILASPEGISRLRALGKRGLGTPEARAAMIGILGASRANASHSDN